jgi:hypothetical protein
MLIALFYPCVVLVEQIQKPALGFPRGLLTCTCYKNSPLNTRQLPGGMKVASSRTLERGHQMPPSLLGSYSLSWLLFGWVG